jgi:tetratricopeptide (TPR) repeat protein
MTKIWICYQVRSNKLNHAVISQLLNTSYSLGTIGNPVVANSYLDKALAIDPNNKFALNNKGAALNGLHHYTQAISNFDKALAIQFYDKALAIDPKYVFVLSAKGHILDTLGDDNGGTCSFNLL